MDEQNEETAAEKAADETPKAGVQGDPTGRAETQQPPVAAQVEGGQVGLQGEAAADLEETSRLGHPAGAEHPQVERAQAESEEKTDTEQAE